MVNSTVIPIQVDPIVVTYSLNNIKVNFELDIGSHVSTISEDKLSLIPNVILNPTGIRAKGYSGNSIKFIGEVNLSVKYDKDVVEHTFLVVSSKCTSLLGRDL